MILLLNRRVSIFGFPGTLGELLIKQWKAKFPESTVIAETLTEKRHPFYQKIGVEGRIRSNRTSDDMKSAKHLVICLPPSAALKGYMEEISNATMLWAVHTYMLQVSVCMSMCTNVLLYKRGRSAEVVWCSPLQ